MLELEKSFNFKLEMWDNNKCIGSINIDVDAETKEQATKKAWLKEIDTLTTHYRYRMILLK